MLRLVRWSPLVLLLALVGCGSGGGGGDKPQITSFTANPTSTAAPGDPAVLTWTVTGAPTGLSIDNGVGTVSGSTATVNPTATTIYTLTASNSSGQTTATATVTVGGGSSGAPTGSFGVSTSASGPFQSDAGGGIVNATDPRVVRVEPNSTLYFQAAYNDPDGITAVVPYLGNDDVDAPLTPGTDVYGFTASAPTGCTLGAAQTTVTCLFTVQVGNIPNISDLAEFAGEFAYVFKVNVTDGAGTVTADSTRGYVIVGDSEPTDPTAPDPTVPDPTDPTSPDPTDPTTPDPMDPTTPDPTEPTEPSDDLEVTILGSETRPAVINTATALQAAVTNAATLPVYAWTQASGPEGGSSFSDAAAKDTSVTFSTEGTYVLQLAVTSGAESASDTVTFNVAATTDSQAPEVNIGGEVSQQTLINVPLNLTSVGTDPDGDTLTYQWSVNFGDATKVMWGSTTTPNTSVTFSAGGSYSLRVTVTDPAGLTDEDDVSISVSVPL